MTPHDHREYVEGCFRCELSRDEVADATPARTVGENGVALVVWRCRECGDIYWSETIGQDHECPNCHDAGPFQPYVAFPKDEADALVAYSQRLAEIIDHLHAYAMDDANMIQLGPYEPLEPTPEAQFAYDVLSHFRLWPTTAKDGGPDAI